MKASDFCKKIRWPKFWPQAACIITASPNLWQTSYHPQCPANLFQANLILSSWNYTDSAFILLFGPLSEEKGGGSGMRTHSQGPHFVPRLPLSPKCQDNGGYKTEGCQSPSGRVLSLNRQGTFGPLPPPQIHPKWSFHIKSGNPLSVPMGMESRSLSILPPCKFRWTGFRQYNFFPIISLSRFLSFKYSS